MLTEHVLIKKVSVIDCWMNHRLIFNKNNAAFVVLFDDSLRREIVTLGIELTFNT